MAVIKQVSIHSNPKKFLKYVLNMDKTEEKLLSAFNTLPKIDFANNTLKKIFYQYYDNRYGDINWEEVKLSKDKKHAVKVHHFIQSFEEGTITPEVAHEIGKEWAKECFGENSVVVVVTHIDKNHVHNHFAVGSYTLDGKKIYSNKETLKNCRKVSDNLCEKHNIKLSVIEKIAENKRLGKKNTYIEDNYVRPRGTSWKAQIEKSIDELLPEVNTLEELLGKLENIGYTVDASGKYIKVKPHGKDRFVRLKSLSVGYDEETLMQKILENLRNKVIIDTNIDITIEKKPLRQLLKEDIDENINQSISFEDFLKRMQEHYTIKQGVHLAFRKDGYGQSFLRSSTIGVDYDMEHIKQRIEEVNKTRKNEVVQSFSSAYDENIVSLEGLKKKQEKLANKMCNLNKKITDLSEKISQYEELKSIQDDYIKFIDVPMCKITILDTINKQKAEVVAFKHGIHNKQQFEERFKVLEDAKNNYEFYKKELNSTTREYRKYSKLINDYYKTMSIDKKSPNKDNLKR